ncbi:TonB-dependent receptor [Massilia sp. TW-1]|uniref:TonB-dependent receptor n=1 Tax=Telluria antibiotica TaxID=2717319 RepID=A0ABX0P4H5_9BURK|nr:TonB-dependent receptor [Telluria antibiotica]
MSSKPRVKLIRSPLVVAVQLALASLALPTMATAQDATTSTTTETTATAAPMNRVEITGSRIRRTDMETPSPVQVITAKDLKESGYTSVSEVLRNITANGQGTLSQAFPGAFAVGASGISLRGLTVGATLVLIDGQRMAPYALSDDGQRSFVDISQIPMEAVERIDVLKDGASSIYGSDAVAGVVNVILKKRYNGAEATADAGATGHGDGRTAHVSGIYGWGDLDADGHNAYLALEYRRQGKILSSSRHGLFTNTDWTAWGGKNLTRGVPTAANGFQPASITGYLIDPGTGATTMLPGCTTAQFNAGQCAYRDRDLELQPTTKNINLLGSFVQKLGGDWQLNLKGSYFRSEAEQLARYANTLGTSGLSALAYGPGIPPQATPPGAPIVITVPATYPGNTTGTPQILQYNFPELGGSRTGVKSDTFRLGADVAGTMGAWDLTAAVGASQNTVKQEITNGFNILNLQAAFNDPVHPYLVGPAASGNTQAMRDAIVPLQHAKATDKLQFVRFSAGRELMPLAGGSLALNLGAEYTHRDLDAEAPPSVANGTQSGNNAWAIGTQNIAAVYGEIVAPVLKNLELDASIRHDKVMTIGQATTPKAGFKWSPISQFTLRGTYTEGFRAPNPAEVGNTGNYFFANTQPDPVLCANPGPDPTTVPGNYPQQCNVSIAGVQAPGKGLKPERSRSYTLGTIIEPTRNLNVSIDYYRIRINNQIISALNDPNYDPTPFLVRGTPTAQPFVNPDGSISTQTPAVGNALFAPYPYENAQYTQTSGIDLDARFTWPFAGGKFSAELTETHLLTYKQGTAGGTAVELAGTHGPSGVSGDTGNPKDRAQLKLGWDQGPLTVSSTVNWIGSFSVVDPSSASAATCADAISFVYASTPPQQFCSVRSFTTVDLFGEYRFSDKLSLHASILNLFDKEPPLDFQTYGSAASTFYNPALHQAGAVGRFFNVGLTYKF